MKRPIEKPILIIGLTGNGVKNLPQDLQKRIMSADLLVGGRRHLGYFSDFQGETLAIQADMAAVGHRLQRCVDEQTNAVVLASGDPLGYGIGTTLRRYLDPQAMEIIPAPTAFQLAFAALREPWHEAALLSAHARPLDAVVDGVLSAPKAAILTDNHQTPSVVANALLTAGLLPITRCAICENLGADSERIVRTNLAQAAIDEYAALNVLVVWNNGQSCILPGLPDEAFHTEAGQITKREIRLLTLAELAVQPNEVVWDIGAGSGSIGIEIARSITSATVYAIEQRTIFMEHLIENQQRFGVMNLHHRHGTAPRDCVDWPDPHAVFIGGSGGRLREILALVQQRLRKRGRLVCNLATLENLQTIREVLPDAQVNQVQINRGVPIQEMLRFQALNPVFMVKWSH